MSSFKTDGVILKRTNFGEADKIFTVFTKHYGKLRLLAKGVRKITSKKAPHLEPFSLTRIFVAKGTNLGLVTEAEVVNNFSRLRSDLKKIGLAYQICELTDRLCPDEQVNRSLFELLVNELIKLNSYASEENYPINDFILKLLWDLGYLPKGKTLPHQDVQTFVEEVMEHKLKSSDLLTKIEELTLRP
ncbi:DNA repair protein RecO [Candidatus Gottesmanbacteria bacterium]|nr:DNA repair protein RecO [Candidatus Gottesmanbacteria bacterium]